MRRKQILEGAQKARKEGDHLIEKESWGGLKKLKESEKERKEKEGFFVGGESNNNKKFKV